MPVDACNRNGFLGHLTIRVLLDCKETIMATKNTSKQCHMHGPLSTPLTARVIPLKHFQHRWAEMRKLAFQPVPVTKQAMVANK